MYFKDSNQQNNYQHPRVTAVRPPLLPEGYGDGETYGETYTLPATWNEYFRNPWVIGGGVLVVVLILWWAMSDKKEKYHHHY